jgi:hypothetical protein
MDENEEEEDRPSPMSPPRFITEDSEELEEESMTPAATRKSSSVYSAYKGSSSRRETLRSAGDRLAKRRASSNQI